MRAQRVREGESRMEMQAAKWTAEGTGNSHYFESAQYSATWGIRQLPGICRYSAKRTGHSVNQGGTAGEFYHTLVLDRSRILSWAGFFIMTVKGVPLARNNCLSFFQNQKRR